MMRTINVALLVAGVFFAAYAVRDDELWLFVAAGVCLGLYPGMSRK